MLQSLPAWGAWVEIDAACQVFRRAQSLPAWGAWVEIRKLVVQHRPSQAVAPRMGSVG